MKLLITGGCGFLGSNLANFAIEQSIELCIFDNLVRYGAYQNLLWLESKGKFKFFHGDIRNTNDVERSIKQFRPDMIFHLAGQVAMTTSISNPRMDFEVNTLGTLNLLEVIRTHLPNTGVIYSSTNKVYGDLEQYKYSETATRYICLDKPLGFDESTPLSFHSPYGCSKGAADQYLRDYSRIFGLKTVVFRHSSMYGGRQYATFDQGWVGWFCKKAIESKNQNNSSITISGSGKQVRDVLHVTDLLRLYFKTAQQIDKVSGKAFNIGGGVGNSLSILELLSLLEIKTNTPLKHNKTSARASDQKYFIANITEIERELNWTPEINCEDGITMAIEWAIKN